MRVTIDLEGAHPDILSRLRPGKHQIQGMIYAALGDSPYGRRHDLPRFKYFTFSDVFPVRDNVLFFTVSSPVAEIVQCVYDWVRQREVIHFGKGRYRVKRVRKYRSGVSERIKSGSPIVLYRDSRARRFFSLKTDGDFTFFMDRLKDNALKKYEAFTGESIEMDEPLFDEFALRKEVVVQVQKRGQNDEDRSFIVIGSVWNTLIKQNVRGFKRLYQFLYDAGLGEKNSLGFGFVFPAGR